VIIIPLLENLLNLLNLRSANFSGADLDGTLFNGTNLELANLRSAINYSINPELNRIRKAKFSMPEAVKLLDFFEIEID